MSTTETSAENRELAGLALVLILYSIIFSSVLFYGWYKLIQGNLPAIPAAALAAILAILAWGIAKIVGSSERGIIGNLPLFLFLLLISAVGIFNTLMIQLEGKSIFLEVIDRSAAQYTRLREQTKQLAANEEVASLRVRIESLKTKLAQEIENPRNCGDGPEANKILEEISQALPGFRRYSGNTRDCSKNIELIGMYFEQMHKLLYASPTFVRNNVKETEAYLIRINEVVTQRLASLEQIRKEINEGMALSAIKLRLDALAADYQTLTLELQNLFPKLVDIENFQMQLNIKEARELGEWGHLLPLFLSRIDKIPTWIYLSVALFMDWLLVHLFARIAEHRRKMPTKRRQMGGLNQGAM